MCRWMTDGSVETYTTDHEGGCDDNEIREKMMCTQVGVERCKKEQWVEGRKLEEKVGRGKLYL